MPSLTNRSAFHRESSRFFPVVTILPSRSAGRAHGRRVATRRRSGGDLLLAVEAVRPVLVVLSERLTGALLYRLTHHVHILEMNGESYRLSAAGRTPPPRYRMIRSTPDSLRNCGPLLLTYPTRLPIQFFLIVPVVHDSSTAVEHLLAALNTYPTLVSTFPILPHWVTVEELADFLRGDGTLFRVAHLRGKALKPLQVQGRLEVRGQSRVGTFPPRKGVAIKFLR